MVPGFVGTTLLGLCLVGFLLAVRIPPVLLPTTSVAPPSLTLASSRQTNQLFDLEPLFLPTNYNTSNLPLPLGSGRESGSMATDFPPNLTISESAGGVTFPEATAVPSKLVDMLSYGQPPNPWPEVGRADIPVINLNARVAQVEVTSAGTGQPIFAFEVPNTIEGTPSLDWAPFEFLIAVDSTGLVAAPMITGSTTTEEVERFFRTIVARTFNFGARLAPGFYIVHIGP